MKTSRPRTRRAGLLLVAAFTTAPRRRRARLFRTRPAERHDVAGPGYGRGGEEAGEAENPESECSTIAPRADDKERAREHEQHPERRSRHRRSIKRAIGADLTGEVIGIRIPRGPDPVRP